MNTEQSPDTQSAKRSLTAVEMEVDCEVRFAVVMYGGVSLAIYINGVAQELLNLVRATAPQARGSKQWLLRPQQLTGAGKVYRKLGQYLDVDPKKIFDPSADPNAPIRTKFIVDVISGTSAGGINGVFLAKALSQNQTMDGLKQLWLTEGDLDKLLNDRRSLNGLPGFKLKMPQDSLLNSQRMYRKLLEALAQMDPSGVSSSVYLQDNPPALSPLVAELDLFTTTTDIEGLPQPIALADRLVFERRYKNVFHFRYTAKDNHHDERDDFVTRNDPFLAFAARCTSSFPFAFEPMCLNHIVEITQGYSRYTGAKNYISTWDDFFSDYLRTGLFDLDRDSRGERIIGHLPTSQSTAAAIAKAKDDLRDAFMTRSFGDGGYLDNKPFTYATATLSRRAAYCNVKRKLLYIEPSPDHPELVRGTPTEPNFAENVRAAVLDLPRQETIREDIQRLQERNSIVNRLITFAQEVDNDLTEERLEPLDVKKFVNAYVEDVVKEKGYGIGYGPYHRLIVGEITSFLAEIVSRAKGHDPTSNAGVAIRELVAAWRRTKYSSRREESKQSENSFLYYNDLHYRFRRVVFLIRRVNAFLRLDPFSDKEEQRRVTQVLRRSFQHARDQQHPEVTVDPGYSSYIDAWLSQEEPDATVATDWVDVAVWWQGFTLELQRIKEEVLIPKLEELRETEHGLLGTPVDPAAGSEYASELKRFRDALDKTDVPWSELRGILSLTNGERRKKADEICQNKKKKFDDVAKHFQKILELRRPKITDSIRDAPASFRPDSNFPQALERDALQGLLSARLCLLYYNKNFIFYDMVMYPVEYGTGAGETTEVEIFRVSPEDAPLLMDEKPGDIESSKLAGRTLMSFGAFLDEPWRRNDMLWGRLDGAERLICTLLPLPDRIALDPNETPAQKTEREILDNKHQERATLIFEAHRGILIEEIKQNNGDAVCTLLRHAAFHPNKDSHAEKLIQALLDEKDDKDVLSKLTAERRARLGTPQSLNRQLNAQSALGYISRSTNITGNMLAGLAENYRIAPAKRFASWMASLGAGLWNLISVAVPESLGSLFFRHWLRLLYFVAAVLILLGLVSPSIKLTGWEFLLIVIALHSIVAGLRSFMEGKLTTDKLKAALWAAAAWFPLALIMTGIIHLIERQFDISLKTWMELSIAGGIALATSLFIFYLRKTEAPALSPDARKLRAEAQPVANKS